MGDVQAVEQLERQITRLRRELRDERQMRAMTEMLLGPKARELAAIWRAEGLVYFSVTPGDGWAELCGEDRAAELLKWKYAERELIESPPLAATE